MDQARLKWLLRRGMKELDVMVSRYHAERYPAAPEAERAAFEQLLDQAEDPDIWAWAMGYADVPEVYQDVIRELRIHR
ncbi:succinate dehydrogenase assembly factor 2 [Flagellatimonas centrodinii]|uniref:FAD assembly factor SdhE n=1 Tax=Flagellatimonas centrodinii TaxID=2806210 RepID=UPI001FFB14A3|nr:succinate dehydrogenase assembly factor 2 [Flagellatimonas centrodinii]ULQ46583.1 succinate dehydrogenase assembly factor 2 [Flagellatimonas centrodinii]